MPQGGNVNVTISDGGSASIIVPGSSVQLVIGCSSSGTVGQIVATRSAQTLQANFGTGPLPEAAALSCLAGGTVLAIKAATASVGTASAVSSVAAGTSVVTVQGAVALSSTTGVGVSPVVVTSSAAHNYATGDIVTISGVTGNTNANGTFPITVLSSTTFSLPASVVANGTGASGSSLKSPMDTAYVQMLVTQGGTIGTGPIGVQLSLDAGRNYGPVLSLGTANALAIPGLNVSLKFAAGTLVAGDIFRFATTEPTWNTAGIQAALNAFMASQYAVQGVGSIHIVGPCNGATASTIQGYLDNLATNFVYSRAFVSARDASPAAVWGGTAETESTWSAALIADYASTQARRICPSAAYWNMPTAFPSPSVYGAPSFRRSLAWAAAARQVQVPAQRHLGRVKDGSLTQIVVNPLTDPQDGFIYHDERINPGLDYIIAGSGGRFMSTMTRTGLPGVYITNPLSAAPLGSDYFLMPLGNVMDVFATIVHQVAQQVIDDDVRVNANGTIYENDARAIESLIASSVNAVMFAQSMISQPVGAGPSAAATGAAIIVDRTTNIRSTSAVNLTGQIIARGYVLTLNAALSYQNPNAAV